MRQTCWNCGHEVVYRPLTGAQHIHCAHCQESVFEPVIFLEYLMRFLIILAIFVIWDYFRWTLHEPIIPSFLYGIIPGALLWLLKSFALSAFYRRYLRRHPPKGSGDNDEH